MVHLQLDRVLLQSFVLSYFLLISHSNVLCQEIEMVTILTDTFPPFILEEGSRLGDAAIIVDGIGRETELTIQWEHVPFGVSYYLVHKKKAALAFPYFKSSDRLDEVYFSDPILTVTSKLYYNRQALDPADIDDKFSGMIIGKVVGYSYGDSLDEFLSDAIEFNSEFKAMEALLKNTIHILPMTTDVSEEILEKHFPNQLQLIQAVEGIQDTSTLHLIASKNKQGKDLLKIFNDGLKVLKQNGLFVESVPVEKNSHKADHGELVSTDGYPIVIGQTDVDPDKSDFLALPQGTQILVLEWSSKISQASTAENIYKSMVDLSRIVVLNGPHVGKELFVKNLHISLL